MYKSAALILFIFIIASSSCKHDPQFVNDVPPGITPPGPNASTICFQSSVLPVFVSNCAKSGCHDAITKAEGIQLDNYNGIMKGIKPGKPNDSKYWEVIITNDLKDRMPPPPASPLTTSQKDSIYKWIVQGALNTTNCAVVCDPLQFSYSITIRSILQANCTGCHGPVSPGGGYDLTSYNVVRSIALNGVLLSVIKQGGPYQAMPPVGKLPDCSIQQITNWVNAGAPNN